MFVSISKSGIKGNLFSIFFSLLVSTFCCAENVIWTEAVSGEPGEVVTIIVKGKTDIAIIDMFINFSFDPQALVFLDRDFSYSEPGKIAEESGGNENLEKGEIYTRIVIGIDNQENNLPPTDNFEIVRYNFQIRSSVKPGSISAGVVLEVTTWMSKTTFVSEQASSIKPEIIPGSITVVPATRPLPPSMLSCKRMAVRARLTWTNLSEYTKLILKRDGVEIIELPGSDETFEDTEISPAAHTYSLAAYKDQKTSFPVTCTVLSADLALPGVEHLTCNRGSSWFDLKWQVSQKYDSIEIRRNGKVIASILGDSVLYRDNYMSEEFILYEVTGHSGDLSTIPVPCQVNGAWVVRVGSVSASPGAKGIEVPLYLSNPWHVPAFSLILGVDKTKFKVKDVIYKGTCLEKYEPFLEIKRDEDNYYIIAVELNVPGPSYKIDPGLETCFMKFILEISEDVEEGEIIPLQLVDGFHNPPAMNVIVGAVNSSSIFPQKLSGELVIGKPSVKGVSGLVAEGIKGRGNVILSWTNQCAYDVIEIEKNGNLVETVPGETTSWRDETIALGALWYRIRGIKNGMASPWKVETYTSIPGVKFFSRGDINSDGKVNIGDAIVLLLYLFQGHEISCQDAADNNDDGKLDLSDAIFLLSYLFLGTEPPPTPGINIHWFDPTPDRLGCNN